MPCHLSGLKIKSVFQVLDRLRTFVNFDRWINFLWTPKGSKMYFSEMIKFKRFNKYLLFNQETKEHHIIRYFVMPQINLESRQAQACSGCTK